MNDKVLRVAGLVFVMALLLHGADHVRRGIDIPSRIATVGGIQFVLGVVAVALVYRRHRMAPIAAIAVGFPSALLFTAAHLLPQGTDPFTGAAASGVTAYSWTTALFEIAADLAFGSAGVVVLRRRSVEDATPHLADVPA